MMSNHKNNNSSLKRRDFVKTMAVGAGFLASGVSLTGCNEGNSHVGKSANTPELEQDNNTRSDSSVSAVFNHGVASGDPLLDRVIIWTRVTPEQDADIKVSWEISEQQDFSSILYQSSVTTSALQDYTVKVDVTGLAPGTRYYYRFLTADNVSATGRTKTLPAGAVDQVKLASVSCARYSSGYYHVYNEIAQRDDLDALLHLGDYIYELGWTERRVNSTTPADQNPRLESSNGKELLTLEDYRREYAIYHTDPDLQAAHASLPFITVWDDHEIANDVWKDGAQNHTPGIEGDLNQRKASAIQAYFEWLPIREPQSGKRETVYRSFEFGDLVSLNMLDTRIVGRDEPLGYHNFMDSDGNFDQAAFDLAYSDPSRELMGAEQKQWLEDRLTASTATWQVLGQQVMMADMSVPAPVALNQKSYEQYADLRLKAETSPESLTLEETEMLNAPTVPYSLQFWDGYAHERETLLNHAITEDKNLVVLSADTHNAWGHSLVNKNGIAAGVEFSTSSVSSEGMEAYRPWEDSEVFANELTSMIDNLEFCNMQHRGFIVTTFSPAEVSNEWVLIDSVKEESYQVLTEESKTVTTKPGNQNRQIIA